MYRLFITVLAVWAGLTLPANAQEEKPGDFDYYVLALSWSPNWCATDGDQRNADQCHPRHDYGWILHGLWPQYHRGWPSYCRSNEPAPSRRMTAEMVDIMGSSGLAWHQWKKHGTCSGLSAESYFNLSRHAYGLVKRPLIFRKLTQPVSLPVQVVEEAFLKANPEMEKDMVTVTCKDNFIQEVRICLTRDLIPTPCGRDAIRDCRSGNARFDPVR